MRSSADALGNRKRGFYERYIKRLLDITCSLAAVILFGWLYIIVALLVRVKLGSPVLFNQPRPGKMDPKTGKEKLFFMYKFRSMSDERDERGDLLPDEARLGRFGKALRMTSLDELPEVFNILKGDMSIVGPRPQLVRDMVFMSDEQRKRHRVRPGLSGLAQVNGRNSISWADKLEWDLQYIDGITFLNDLKIIFLTIKKVFMKEGINQDGQATALDYGDYLLLHHEVSEEEYAEKQRQAGRLLDEMEKMIKKKQDGEEE